ncbi:hypothetical protein QYE76_053247 [Lolium multiflorum]|uniref:TF-B3 domain-containing protein n=1 Tax=Lolium multiflorum TaxID=4521 RepID=A0AAD8SX40_LOLMU|nr:hypothetical protein QYE76_053247 [Lolium multiflorum]
MEMRDSTICEMSDSTICEMSDSTICELDECLHFESMSDTPSSMDDETPIMEKMYMVHEDDDITPCLLEDEHGGHMEPTTSTTPTSYERDYKGTQNPMSTSIEHELTKRALESMIQMQKQTRSNVNEQLRLRTVDCTCPLHRPEFRIQRNSLAKKPKVTGRRDAAIQRCILKGRGKGRPKRVGHSADPPQPSRFYVQLDGNDDMYMLVIPREFKQCLKGILPRPIKLKTSVGCAWYVHIDEYQGELVLKDGWFGFAEAHELQLDDLLVFECSNKKLKLGESLSWKETSVEPAPVCKVFGRIDEENTPDSFCKVLCTSELEVISIPSRVLPWFYGGCPESINLKMSTACTWIVDLKQQDGNVLMDAGWPEFVKAHDLKVGYLLTFKKLDTKSLQVLIFGYNCCEKDPARSSPPSSPVAVVHLLASRQTPTTSSSATSPSPSCLHAHRALSRGSAGYCCTILSLVPGVLEPTVVRPSPSTVAQPLLFSAPRPPSESGSPAASNAPAPAGICAPR